MPRLPYARLERALASAPPAPAYYLHGGESVLKDEALNRILASSLDPATRDFNLDLLSASQVDPGELAAACSTLPMMAERRAVVLRDVEAWKRKSKGKQPALQYLEHPAAETVLVMVQGTDDDPDDDLAARSQAIDCAPLTGDQLEQWLEMQLEKGDVRLTDNGREHLVRATGGDMGMLLSEIAKLRGLASAGEIDADTVASLVGIRSGETIEDWRDAILRDDTRKALDLTPRVLEQTGVTGVGMITMLGTSLLLVRWTRVAARRESRPRGQRLADLLLKEVLYTVRPFVGRYGPLSTLIAQVVEHWPLSRLKPATRAVLEADIALKNTTVARPADILTELVLELGQHRQRKAA